MKRTGRPGGAFRDNYGGVVRNNKLTCLRCQTEITNRSDRLKSHNDVCSKKTASSAPTPARLTFHASETEYEDSPLPAELFTSPTPTPPPFTPTPTPSSVSDGDEGPSAKRLSSSSSRMLANYFVRTSDSERARLQVKWAKAFYRNHWSFRSADSPTFQAALEATRPGLTTGGKGREFLSRKLLRGRLLDEINEEMEEKMKEVLNKQYATMVSDGWSDIQNKSIIANVMVHDGNVFVADFQEQPGQKTAEACAEQIKESILKAEEKYGAVITSFISDNENKMKRVRCLLQIWRPSLVAVACGAHLLNLCEKKAAPATVKEGVAAIQKFFRNHHQPHMKLLQLGGKQPQLANETRWLSQKAMFGTFVANHALYTSIRDQGLAEEVKGLIDNRLLLHEAKALVQQLEAVESAMNVLQSDSAVLSDGVRAWLKLIMSPAIPHDSALMADIKLRFVEYAKEEHLLMYLADHRRILAQGDEQEWPRLPEEMENAARTSKWVATSDMAVAFAEYEMGLCGVPLGAGGMAIWPKTVFRKALASMNPRGYWNYLYNVVVNKSEAKDFSDMMLKFCACPTSNAAVERKFSAAALDQTALRNRMKASTIEKLLRVTSVKEGDSSDESDDNFM